MATLALSLAGQVVGGALGGPIGATLGRALGALAGSTVDNLLFGDHPETAAPSVRLSGSREGAPIPKLYGWSRLAGNIIWATDLEAIDAAETGAKGTTNADGGVAASFAIAFCEGEVQRLGRVWADGQLLDTSGATLRFYGGSETQAADSLIEAVQGDDAPGYRGLCYIVFERLPLAPFGNRVPSIEAEICRVVGELEPMIRAVTVIPGATEFGYDPATRVRLVSPGVTAAENTHLSRDVSDWTLSIDELLALCPNLEHVSLVVAWFGDDLRAAHCTIRPKVEAAGRSVRGTTWSVAGLGRADAGVVSTHDGGPAYGGTPSDAAVLAAIADLKARGIAVTLYPIVLMDIPVGNALGQPAYPWRGRIAVSPSADGTGAAATEIAAFAGDGSGWDFRRFILHYAGLVHAAGGVDTMLLCSELRGLTFARGTGNSFPFVSKLVTLAHDARAVFAGDGTKLTYGADWSEYSGLQPGGGAKFFHLDPLWASADIAAVGIDNYMPLADWRDGGGPDAAEWDGPYDAEYLAANIAGGEGFDWYYAADANRTAGTRTPITDGAYGEPWVWRFKDIAGWWGNAHHDRPGGVRSATATAWVPGSKPIWFTEFGCGAVDKGANQPNLFSDPKSSEDGKPYFSNGVPDPLMQRQALRAVLAHWADDAKNPVAPAYGGRMLERTYLWTWDARPYPAFPQMRAVWSDGANYATGHWLTGRLGAMASDELAHAVATDFGVALDVVSAGVPFVQGYVVDGPTTARAALEPLLAATGMAVHDAANGLCIGPPNGRAALAVTEVVADEAPRISRRRPDPGEAVGQLALSYVDRERDYLPGAATAIAAGAGVLESASAGLVLDLNGARTTVERLLQQKLAQPDTLELTLPPSALSLEVGDAIEIGGDAFEVTEIRDGLARKVSARAIVDTAPITVAADRLRPAGTGPSPAAEPVVVYAELPPAIDGVAHPRLGLAAYALPWPGHVEVSDDGTGATVATLPRAATLGELTAPLATGGIYLWDDRNAVQLVLYSGHLSSRDEGEVLAGANRIAVATNAGCWEVIGFANAALTAPRTYRLTHLLRGQWGSDFAIGACAAGNRVLLLDTRPELLPVPGDWLDTTLQLRSFAGPTDPVGTAAAVPIGLAPVLPLAPVHLAAVRGAGGDVTLRWVRRSRADADSWAVEDAPLDCVPEAYRVTLYSGVTAVRTIAASAAVATYTAAQQTTDFGGLPSSFAFTVAQLSPLYGPGHAAAGTFHA